MQVFSGIRSAERVVHGTVGGCDGRSLLEVTGRFCAFVGLARSVRLGPLLGIDGGAGVYWLFFWIFDMIDLFRFFDLAFILAMIWILFGILYGFILWELHEIYLSVQL